MCNNLHSGSIPIPKSGYGWKITTEGEKGGIASLIWLDIYKEEKNGLIKWRHENGGFCFFLTKKEAVRGNKAWMSASNSPPNRKIMKIRYFDGMGKQEETAFVGGCRFKIALCKSFRFVK